MVEHPLAALKKIDPKLSEHLGNMDEFIYGSGALPRKIKLLYPAGLSLSYRDYPKSRYDKQLKLEIPDKAQLFGYNCARVRCSPWSGKRRKVACLSCNERRRHKRRDCGNSPRRLSSDRGWVLVYGIPGTQ